MSQTVSVPVEIEEARSSRILTAAERAFARHGFHGASMQHVAAEAGMSAGNLYRYFQSKDAIVSGLTSRDQEGLAADFQALADAPDFLSGIGAMLRKHLVEEPRWRTQLMLEIWAEAARNPAIASMCNGIDGSVDDHLRTLIRDAQARAPDLGRGEADYAVRVMKTVVDGLFKRRATEPGFEGESEIAMALGIFRAALDGTLQPYRPTQEPRS